MNEDLKITESFFYEGSVDGLKDSLIKRNNDIKVLTIIVGSHFLWFMEKALNCDELKHILVFEDYRMWQDGYYQIISQVGDENVFDRDWEL